jgi:hypothetical protein
LTGEELGYAYNISNLMQTRISMNETFDVWRSLGLRSMQCWVQSSRFYNVRWIEHAVD